jgi:hypothetical protein
MIAIGPAAGHDGRVFVHVGVVALSRLSPRRLVLFVIATATFVLAACASPTVTTNSTISTSPGVGATAPPALATPVSSAPPGSASPAITTTGFAFTAEDVVAYYASQGYACAPQQPSTKAAGFSFRTCQKVDEAGRTRVIGVVTDPGGGLANGFASVQGKDTETFLAPVDALEPLAGFLGAMFGGDRGSTLLPWLAGHLGDTYAETTIGAIKVATYTESADNHSKLYVEVANQAYLDAPGS